MHYSQKRRYYFFIAIVKFKIILSYYPPLAQAFPPLLILRSTFAQPSLNLRSTFAQPSLMIAPHLHHTYATHFGKLSEFAKVNQLRQLTSPPLAQASPPLLILRHILGCASSPTFLRHILGCASSPTFLRLSFAQPSLKVR